LAVSIAAAATELSVETRAAIHERLAPYLREGEVLPDAGLLQELLGRFLEAQGNELVAADSVYQAEVRDHRLARVAHLEAMRATRADLRWFRQVVESIFGTDHCKLALGTRNFTTRNPAILAGLARQASQVLRQPAFYFIATTPGSVGTNSASLAAALEARATALQESTSKLLGNHKLRRQIELGNKDAALAATKQAISEAATLLKGLFVFTGNRFVARRLRPSHKKKGGRRPDPPAGHPVAE
jgi:hypothetical protein